MNPAIIRANAFEEAAGACEALREKMEHNAREAHGERRRRRALQAEVANEIAIRLHEFAALAGASTA